MLCSAYDSEQPNWSEVSPWKLLEMASASDEPPRFWPDEDPAATAPEFPPGEAGLQLARLFIRRMQIETEYWTAKLLAKGIPIQYDILVWENAISTPYKCDSCMKSWNFWCCCADMYRLLRDTEHVDREDYERFLAYCPSITQSAEPEEWQDLNKKRRNH